MEDSTLELEKDDWSMLILNGSELINRLIRITLLYLEHHSNPYTNWCRPDFIDHLFGHYGLKGTELYISCGPLRITNTVKEISSITSTNDIEARSFA